MFTVLGANLVFHQEDCRDVVRLEDILSGVSPFLSYPLASKLCSYHCYDSLTCSQYVTHKCAALSVLSHAPSGV